MSKFFKEKAEAFWSWPPHDRYNYYGPLECEDFNSLTQLFEILVSKVEEAAPGYSITIPPFSIENFWVSFMVQPPEAERFSFIHSLEFTPAKRVGNINSLKSKKVKLETRPYVNFNLAEQTAEIFLYIVKATFEE